MEVIPSYPERLPLGEYRTGRFISKDKLRSITAQHNALAGRMGASSIAFYNATPWSSVLTSYSPIGQAGAFLRPVRPEVGPMATATPDFSTYRLQLRVYGSEAFVQAKVYRYPHEGLPVLVNTVIIDCSRPTAQWRSEVIFVDVRDSDDSLVVLFEGRSRAGGITARIYTTSAREAPALNPTSFPGKTLISGDLKIDPYLQEGDNITQWANGGGGEVWSGVPGIEANFLKAPAGLGGKVNGADFTGFNGRMSSPSVDFNGATSFLASMVLRIDIVDTTRYPFLSYQGTTTSNRWFVQSTSGGTLSTVLVGVGSNLVVAVNIAAYLGVWAHFVQFWNGQTCRVFINGVQIASSPRTGTMVLSAPGEVALGATRTNGSRFRGGIALPFLMKDATEEDFQYLLRWTAGETGLYDV